MGGPVNRNAQAFCARDVETNEESGIYGIDPESLTWRDKTRDGACGDGMGHKELFAAVIARYVADLNIERRGER